MGLSPAPGRGNAARIVALAAVLVIAGAVFVFIAHDTNDESAPAALKLDTANDVPAPGPGSSAAGEADWISRPDSIAAAAKRARAGVVATVSHVSSGPDLVAAPDESNPTAVITLRVRERWFGDIPDEFQINWLGAPGNRWIEGDPPYRVGQDYILFLIPREDGNGYRPESPDARMQILNGRPRGLIEGPVATAVEARTPDEVKAIAVEAVR